MNDCPGEEHLAQYAVGDLSEGEARTVEQHLGRCTHCLSRLDALAKQPDPVVSALRGSGASIAPASPALARAIAAVLAGTTATTDAPVREVVLGTVIGGYRILELLGHGGMGRVYRARHPRLDQEVALKVLRAGADSRQFVARFDAERQALAMMDHPSIARMFDGGMTDEGQPYFVMELVTGTTITRYCADKGLNLFRCLELFVEVCQAVQHAHQKGMIHRDLKPSNVLVAEYDGQPVPKIIDFGIAKAIEGRGAPETEIGLVVGTLEYMSPEQAGLSSRDLDTRSDIYALGVLLYELLTGDTPLSRQRIRALPVIEVLRLIREEEPQLPSLSLTVMKPQAQISFRSANDSGKLAKQVRGELDWIALKALDKDRAQRYESAAALADDVRRFLNDELVLAGPRSNTYRLKKFLRRNRRSMTTFAALLLLLLGSVVISAWLALESREARAKAEIDRDQAEAAGKQAKLSAAEARSVLIFFQERVLAVGRPEGQEGGLGREVTIRQAVDAAEPRISESFEGQPLVEASVRNTLGTTYIYVGDPAAAVAQFERAWELRRDNLGADHVETMNSLHELGIACRQAGKLENALKFLEQAWLQRAANLGRTHRDTLRSLNELAAACLATGDLERATTLANQAVDELSATLGVDHIDTLLSQSCLASVEKAAGRLKSAVTRFEVVVTGMKSKLGDEHSYTLAAMNNLGLAYLADGQLELAVPLFELAKEIQQRRLGPDHLHTLTSMNNLALAYIELHQPDKAIPLLLQVQEGRNSKLSSDHPSILLCMNTLAEAYQLTGQSDLAFPLLERVFEISKTRMGIDHPDTLNAMNNFAALHFFAGRVEQAIALHQETLKLRTAKLGVDHLDTLISMNNLAYCYWTAKKNDLSIDLFQQTVEGRTAVLGPDHPQTLAAIMTLSAVLRDIGQSDQAVSLLENAVADRQSRLGADHRVTQRLVQELAVIRIILGRQFLQEQKFVEAEEILRLALTAYEQQPDSWEYFVICSQLGGALSGQMKFADAEPLLLLGYEGMMKHESKNPANTKPRRAEGLERLIQLYETWDKPEAAEKWRAYRDEK